MCRSSRTCLLYTSTVVLDNCLSRISHIQRRFFNNYGVLRQIETKLINSNAHIIKADKENTLVGTEIDLHTTKIHDFISKNNISLFNFDPTGIFAKNLYNSIYKCVHLFNGRTGCY